MDAIIVLGAAVVAPDVPGPALERRLDFGVGVFKQTNARYLVLSGGLVAAPPEEAVVMCRLAVARGIPKDRIIVEAQARNTFENAVFAGAMIRDHGWREVLVVTDGYHLRRALFIFRRLGLRVRGLGVPRPHTLSRWSWYRSSALEHVRLAYSAVLFVKGAHKPIIDREWGVGEP
ncbi:MAG: YdcF family protein [Hyphomicrobiales bacterium]|nr:YdcF family protein [Hyphomicrobiales bacterium]